MRAGFFHGNLILFGIALGLFRVCLDVCLGELLNSFECKTFHARVLNLAVEVDQFLFVVIEVLWLDAAKDREISEKESDGFLQGGGISHEIDSANGCAPALQI